MLKFLKGLFGPKADFKTLIQNGAIIIDVRTPEEFKTGHIKGSVNIPVNKIAGQASKLKKEGHVVITCCRSGARSAMARETLKANGIEAYNGGAWDGLKRELN
ncbi:MAG TPA: rhodanese-like domain-containing protein [Bacteroidia bacterium]|nr:rhodanese-like domain-containing protein [Bacteroidia bacterium]